MFTDIILCVEVQCVVMGTGAEGYRGVINHRKGCVREKEREGKRERKRESTRDFIHQLEQTEGRWRDKPTNLPQHTHTSH